ncbi:hypothetical protein [Streptomyces sp. DT171]|uniref:hypothetical protein n=1 Tax=Streptomyces sp. DT171 TaxID=3416524 RepID=UPI003CF1081B
MNAREHAAAELDQLADDLAAILAYEQPVEHRDGPWLPSDDTAAAGYDAVMVYARERAEWLRMQN